MARHKREAPDAPIVREDVTATVLRSRGTRDGRLYWRIRTRDTARRTVATGWWTRSQAEGAVDALRHQGIPSPPERRAGGVRTVADLLHAWIAHQTTRHAADQIADRTLANYRQSVGYWLAALGDVLASQMTRAMIEDQVTAWQAAGVAPRTCAHAVTVIKAAYRWGGQRGHTPPLDLSRLTVRVHDDEYVYCDTTPTREQADAAIARIPPGRERDVALLLSLTGCRIGEAAALRVGDVDLAGRVLTLSGRDESRGRRGKVTRRRWPIGGDLGPLLQRLTRGREADEPLVADLPTDADRVMLRAFEAACAAAEVPRFTPHGLRRMVVMELLDVGDAKSASKLTGHSVQTLLKRYVRPTDASLRDLVTRAGIGRRKEGRVYQLRAQNAGTGGGDPE